MLNGLNSNIYIYPGYNNYAYKSSSRTASKNVAFTGRDFLTLPKDQIYEKIEKSINDKNLLGEGKEAKVYRIEDTNYCVRLCDNEHISRRAILNFSLSEEDKINHVVAHIGNSSSIIKYFYGIDAFAPDIKPIKQQELKSLIKAVPIESFQKLLAQIAHAKEKDMIFDCCGANVIINPKTKDITAIDFYKNSPYEPEVVRPLSSIYSALTTVIDDADYKRSCANKILNAGIKEISKPSDLCLPVWEFDFSNLLYKLKQDSLIENNTYYTLMRNIFTDIQRLKGQELRGQDVSIQLNGKLKVIKSLINQLF